MKRWYVVQIYAGYEQAVKEDIIKHVVKANVQDLFGEVLVPSAKVQKSFSSAEPQDDQQLFPGYILVELEAVPEAIRLVLATPRVVRFLGGKEPAPLSKIEVERVLAQIRGDVAVVSEKQTFEVDKEVEIVGGPFAGFVGIIEKVNEDAEKLSVMVSIFGRMTPVELGFDQVKR